VTIDYSLIISCLLSWCSFYKGVDLFKQAVAGKAKIEEFETHTISAMGRGKRPHRPGQ